MNRNNVRAAMFPRYGCCELDKWGYLLGYESFKSYERNFVSSLNFAGKGVSRLWPVSGLRPNTGD